MPFDGGTESILRQLDYRAKCANPFCDELARVRGEFCPACIEAQRRTREALRAQQAQEAAR